MKKYFTILSLLISLHCFSQTLQSFKAPDPPKVFEFTKYDQIPVGEYTGIPNISVPLYNINVDDVNVPITLQYHAGGIRVSDEASYVGLGWNLNFGMVTQTINGLDDLQPYNKRLLKYQINNGPLVEWQILCYTYSAFGYPCSTSDCNPEPVFTATTPQATNSAFIATGNAFIFPNQAYCFADYNYASYDMEPDIFRVNFFGHSLRFIKKITGTDQGQIEVLDNNGYKIEMISNNDAPNANSNGTVDWKVITPDGDQYFFSGEKITLSSSNSAGDPMSPGGGGGNSSSKTWMISKIITKKNKVISFEYSNFGQSESKSYSQSVINASNFIDNSYIDDLHRGYPSILVSSNNSDKLFTTTTTNGTSDWNIYVSKITTPEEEINFSYSSRLDRTNTDQKLDNITVKNLNTASVLKQFNFSYSYFYSTGVGNQVAVNSTGSVPVSTNGSAISYRLKLLLVQEIGKKPYNFSYNSTPLPVKNSTAVDFWGFYNGQTANLSLAPNPSTLGHPEMGSNGNNKSAYIDYTRAYTLEKIIYPTGGSVNYEYELNNYSVGPYEMQLTNSDNSTGTISGAGLRLKSISLINENGLARKTNYSYSGGINITPFKLYTSYDSSEGSVANPASMFNQNFTVKEFGCSNYVQPSQTGSFNAVGYSQVTAENISNTGNGKTVWTFVNKKDALPLQADTNGYFTYNKMSLPSLSDINSSNGDVLTEDVYAQDSATPVMSKVYTYSNKKSNIYYGNKISQFRYLYHINGISGSLEINSVPQFLVGYYAVYGKHSLKSSEKVTEYFTSGNLETTTYNTYNNNDVLTSTFKISPSITTGEYYKEVITPSTAAIHLQKNMLNLPSVKYVYTNGVLKEQYNFSYIENNGITVPSEVDILPLGNSDSASIKKVFYDIYDDTGNILQYHNENGIYTYVIWGYNKLLPIAKIENCDAATFATATASTISTLSNLQTFSNSDVDSCYTGTCSEKNLRDALNNLRALLPNCMVTTFTHNPLIGVTSVTDVRGYTTYYEYDEYQRLKQVLDADGNALSKNEYHYK